MYSHVLFICIFLAGVSCQSRLVETSENSAPQPAVLNADSQTNNKGPAPEVPKLVDSFSDDKNIGVPRKNKVEINNYELSNSHHAVIKFYALSEDKQWILKQSFEFDKNTFRGISNIDPQVEDFNNDGLKDFTYRSAEPARGANVVRTLFLYDKKLNELVHITNSEEYPNLSYNKKLDCIDAWMFHGATTTVFLRLEGDKLREFASVDTGLERIVTLTDKSGKKRVVSRRKMKEEDIYTRYVNFNPPE